MSRDLFSDAVDDGWNRSRITDDFLAEADPVAEETAPPAPAPAPQPRQQPVQQPPRPSFVPEGYEPPSAIQARRERLIQRYKLLDTKLQKARGRDAANNPYAFVNEAGHNEFDNLAYNDDMRELNRIKLEVDQLNEKLRDSRDTFQSSQQGVRQYARDFYLAAERQISEPLRAAAKAKYSAYFNDLVRSGHFESPANLTPERLDQALANIIRAAIGDAVLAQQSAQKPGPKAPGTTEDDPRRQSADDEFADWPEESRRMFAAWEKAESGKGGTLADRAKQGGSR